MLHEEIVQNIDITLDQLIRNAEAIADAELISLSNTELDAFQKTQESLLQHLLQMDQILEKKQKVDKRSATVQIRDKRHRFETLKMRYTKDLAVLEERRLILSKRKGKRFFDSEVLNKKS